MLFPSSITSLLGVVLTAALTYRIVYNVYFHPLAKFPGPWYAKAFSFSAALISVLRLEPYWLHSLVKKYGTEKPIRIQPNMLLFPKPSALKEIYWDPKNNHKSDLYGTGILGPPHLFSTLDGDTHRDLRKALGGQQWTIGSLKNKWEPRVDDQVSLFVQKMNERVETQESVCISDKVAEFAADIMTMLSFTHPFGFVKNSRDERNILGSWRQGLDFFGFAGRSKFFQNYLMHMPGLGAIIFPKITDNNGMGWLMGEAYRQVNEREALLKKDSYEGDPDFMQHCLDARRDGQPLTDGEKVAHVTLLIQAGADTTGTGLGSTLRYLMINPEQKLRAQNEIDEADRAGKLSTPVKYEEVREHLPFFVACIKESLRLDPPATNLFARNVVGKGGKTIDGYFIPPETDITSNAYVVQRDPELYAPDPTSYRPGRWLESKEKANELEAASFVFGVGPRVCLGKDIAIMELYKLLPEIVRRFEMKLLDEGRYVVAGGVAYNHNLQVRLTRRDSKAKA